ncbi:MULTISPECIES: RICIN domain-containing protein [unclassified Streptomyces]|uniref:RICIN domain-containing protein n=1 Tax=Streptomyces TaxID=1883 RepID=UPI002A747669|nr:RICIN domain-containing protein [Streptomyces sp. KN37]WPO70777.1 hypothetical protein R9806_09120 [Streptomyces sp. KN37]
MAIESGTYFIKCAAYADRVLDLSGSITAPNVPVIGWHWQKSENQKWEITQTHSPYEVIIRSVLGELFLNLSTDRSYPPKLAVQPFYVVWSLAPVAENAYRVSYPGTLQVATLSSDSEGTQAIIESGTLSPSQEWLFERA